MSITRINPDNMFKSPNFTQVATVSASAKLVFVGGQNGVNREGKVVGKDITSQSEQAYKNVISALEAAGATLHDVFKMNVYLLQGQSAQEGFAAVQKVTPKDVPPPIITVIMVAAFANPEFLVEIEAVAAIGE